MSFAMLATLVAVGAALVVGFVVGWLAHRASISSGRAERSTGPASTAPAASARVAPGDAPPGRVSPPRVSPPAGPVATSWPSGGDDVAVAPKVPSAAPATSPPATSPNEAPALDLAAARSWGYQLQDIDVAHAAASPFDLLVVDVSRHGDEATALSPAEVRRLKCKPDGGRRLVLAYLSIGEAESYRSYWRKEWSRQPPAWLLGENPEWEDNYSVCFWHPEWQAVLCGKPEACLDRILAQGFDGIYLDKCDVTEDLERHERKAASSRTDLAGDMVDLVARLAAYARQRQPGFLVVMQNAEPLLERPRLRGLIDAVAKEELLYGLDSSEKPNARADVTWSRERLDLMVRDHKPVFVVEYLSNRGKIATARDAAQKLGYVLFVSDKSRELDSLDYAAPMA